CDSAVDWILAKRNERPDFAGFQAIGDRVKFCTGLSIKTENQSGANRVRISNPAQQNVVALAEPRDDVDVTNAEKVGNFAREPQLFVGHSSRRDDSDVKAAEL